MDNIVSIFKKGVTTSEFWFGFLAAVYAAVKQAWQPVHNVSQAVTVFAPVIGAAVYGFGRTYLKTHRLGAVTSTNDAFDAGVAAGIEHATAPAEEPAPDAPGVAA